MHVQKRRVKRAAHVFLWVCLAMTVTGSAQAGGDLVIYLHNAWYEAHKDGSPHPKFGVYHLQNIHDVLGKGTDFRAPERSPAADPTEAATGVVEMIRAELEAGRKASSIKVIGASKGGVIAMLASTLLAEPDVRWVIIGGCSAGPLKTFAPKLTGHVLSIYETSDSIAGPCPDEEALTASTTKFTQIRTDTGRDHGFLFSADPVWTSPAANW